MMKVYLLYPDRDVQATATILATGDDLIRDLALEPLWQAMAQGDAFIRQVVRQVMLASLNDPELIRYRQAIVQDCLRQPALLRELYQIPLEFLERKQKQWLWISPRYSSASSILSGARRLLEVAIELLRQLRRLADRYQLLVMASGWQRFFRMIQHELDDDYLASLADHLAALRFPRGVLFSAHLGQGNEGADLLLCKPCAPHGWSERLRALREPVYSYVLHPRDEAGTRILGELRDRALARVANALAQAAEHVESFFAALRFELAFYLGCLNLAEQLQALNLPFTFPQPQPATTRQFTGTALYDISLALATGQRVVGNDIAGDGRDLVIITGPNQGGKTTFLRSVGLAYLMMQSGMFVAAQALTASVSAGIFTHFQREEDKTMTSGKFEEELMRLSAIVTQLTPNALLLLNESFATTNKREGAEIACQVITALLHKRIRVIIVTHIYEFARRMCAATDALCLGAERLPDGTRTYRMRESLPAETSFASDLFRRIFSV